MPNTKVVGIIFPYILTPIPNLYDHSFPRYGQITFLTFRRPTTLTFDLKFWKYLSVTVYPYVICMPSFIMIGWEMAEILHFEILRKHGQTNTQTNTHTNKQTHTQTDMGITIPRPPPMGGEVISSGFYIYILERSFCLMLYNIAMIQHYSRCVIRQLLWLRSTYPNAWFRLGFYMFSLQELSANWLLPQAHDRSVPGARETYYTRIPWQRTTSHLTRALMYKGEINV